MRRANICDPTLKLINVENTSDIHKHKQTLRKEHLDAHWDHRHNTHIYHYIVYMSIQQSTYTHTQHIHNIQQQQNKNHIQKYGELF